MKREYADFGPPLAAEYLGEKHGVVVSKETVRQILIEAGVWERKRRRVEEVHVWRARRPCCGEMVQWDSSEHDWLEGRGPKFYLLAMLDDATSRALARFAKGDEVSESTFRHSVLVGEESVIRAESDLITEFQSPGGVGSSKRRIRFWVIFHRISSPVLLLSLE